MYNAINNGINVKIEANIETRVNNLLKEYVHDTDNELITSLHNLRKYLGDSNIDKYIKLIGEHDYKPVIEELIIKYYDPLYEHRNRVYEAVFYNDNELQTTNKIIEWAKDHKYDKN